MIKIWFEIRSRATACSPTLGVTPAGRGHSGGNVTDCYCTHHEPPKNHSRRLPRKKQNHRSHGRRGKKVNVQRTALTTIPMVLWFWWCLESYTWQKGCVKKSLSALSRGHSGGSGSFRWVGFTPAGRGHSAGMLPIDTALTATSKKS